jgi:hypothetical protein
MECGEIWENFISMSYKSVLVGAVFAILTAHSQALGDTVTPYSFTCSVQLNGVSVGCGGGTLPVTLPLSDSSGMASVTITSAGSAGNGTPEINVSANVSSSLNPVDARVDGLLRYHFIAEPQPGSPLVDIPISVAGSLSGNLLTSTGNSVVNGGLLFRSAAVRRIFGLCSSS